MNKIDTERVKIIESKRKYKDIGEKLFNKLEKDKIFNKMSITTEQRRKDIKKIDLLYLLPKIDSLGRSEKTKEFSHSDRTFTLLSFYLFLCENIKNIFTRETYERIYDKLPEKPSDVNENKIKRYVTLFPAIQILEKYIEHKKISENKVFDVIDVDLRNSIAHSTFEDNKDFLKYPIKSGGHECISGEEMIRKILHAGAIFTGLQEAKMDFYAKGKKSTSSNKFSKIHVLKIASIGLLIATTVLAFIGVYWLALFFFLLLLGGMVGLSYKGKDMPLHSLINGIIDTLWLGGSPYHHIFNFLINAVGVILIFYIFELECLKTPDGWAIYIAMFYMLLGSLIKEKLDAYIQTDDIIFCTIGIITGFLFITELIRLGIFFIIISTTIIGLWEIRNYLKKQKKWIGKFIGFSIVAVVILMIIGLRFGLF